MVNGDAKALGGLRDIVHKDLRTVGVGVGNKLRLGHAAADKLVVLLWLRVVHDGLVNVEIPAHGVLGLHLIEHLVLLGKLAVLVAVIFLSLSKRPT